MAPRHLFIVARAHPGMYDYLREQFTADAEVEILLDRRRRDRRTSRDGIPNERRQADRRTRSDVDPQLRERTHVFLTLPDAAQAPAGDDDRSGAALNGV